MLLASGGANECGRLLVRGGRRCARRLVIGTKYAGTIAAPVILVPRPSCACCQFKPLLGTGTGADRRSAGKEERRGAQGERGRVAPGASMSTAAAPHVDRLGCSQTLKIVCMLPTGVACGTASPLAYTTNGRADTCCETPLTWPSEGCCTSRPLTKWPDRCTSPQPQKHLNTHNRPGNGRGCWQGPVDSAPLLHVSGA